MIFMPAAYRSFYRAIWLASFLGSPLRAVAAAADPAAGLRTGQPHAQTDAQPSSAAILAHPEMYGPFTYAIVVRDMWAQGRRLQAAFWFYVFQARTRPWSAADMTGDGAAALRGALNEELGPAINGWVGSDLEAWRALAQRAVSYEARLPLCPQRPEGISAAAWRPRST